MAAGGHFGSPIWAILDDRKSLSIAFLAISDQYTIIFFQNGHQRPFWKSEHFYTKWPPEAILFSIDATNPKVLVIWDLKMAYGEYEFGLVYL